MQSTVEYNPELGVVMFKYVGRVTVENFKKETIVGLDLAKKNNTNLFLIDDTDLEDAGSIFDLYDLPKFYEEIGADRNSKVALILPPPGTAAAEDAHFYETTCQNQGWQVKVFSERQEAINWLLNNDLSNMSIQETP